MGKESGDKTQVFRFKNITCEGAIFELVAPPGSHELIEARVG
jgi:hypothetical protein